MKLINWMDVILGLINFTCFFKACALPLCNKRCPTLRYEMFYSLNDSHTKPRMVGQVQPWARFLTEKEDFEHEQYPLTHVQFQKLNCLEDKTTIVQEHVHQWITAFPLIDQNSHQMALRKSSPLKNILANFIDCCLQR